jgi:PIN domain nuclease of toxin-antitoxin system
MGGLAVKLLLDTHIWLWAVGDRNRLARAVADAVRDPENELWLSPISCWEAVLLAQKKRIEVDTDIVSFVGENLGRLPFREAPITHQVALATAHVRLPHRDPADRILAATALVYQLTLVTADERLLACPDVPVLANR